MANPIISDNGQGTLTANAVTLVITHAYTMDDTTYYVGIESPYQTSYWITAKSTTAFTINFGATHAYNQTIGWKIEGRGAKT